MMQYKGYNRMQELNIINIKVADRGLAEICKAATKLGILTLKYQGGPVLTDTKPIIDLKKISIIGVNK